MIKVAVFGIVASLIAMKIKTIRPEIAVVIAVISSILLAMYGLKQMEEILTVFEMIRALFKNPTKLLPDPFKTDRYLLHLRVRIQYLQRRRTGIDCKADRVCRKISDPDCWTSSL